MTTKEYITPQVIHDDSFKLAHMVHQSGFEPDFMIALWRGGTPIGCHVHEYFKFRGLNTDHIAIRTSRYEGVDQAKSTVQVHNLGYLTERLNAQSKVLIVDDVFDSGITIKEVLLMLQKKLGDAYPNDIRIATLYFKPTRNQTMITPNYYVHETNKWIVFSHELEGLDMDEIKKFHGEEVAKLLE